MGGNAIRAYEIARALGAHADVELLAPPAGGEVAGVVHVPAAREDLPELRARLRGADMVLALPPNPVVAAELRRSEARVVYDLYDPRPLQALEDHQAGSRRSRRFHSRLALDHYLSALESGDSFICASERQRDLWIGAMVGAGLLSPQLYDRDPSLRDLLDVVPFGVPDEPPVARGEGPREHLAQLGPDTQIVLWNGGLWNWLDPVGAVEAVAAVHARRPSVRLLFMGRAPLEARQATAARSACERARGLGLLDEVVVFNDSWVPYGSRADWLLQADCALSMHVEHLETRFSFRTRILDCLWAGLPVVCTRGDELADMVDRDMLGAGVGPGDVPAAAAAIEEVLERGRESFTEPLARAARTLRWSEVVAPLVRWAQASPAVPRSRPRLTARSARALATRLGRRGLRLANGPTAHSGRP
jgi:glycosyltransferase involved in cell wall biosynthesis